MQKALAWLAANQAPNGSFTGQASAAMTPFMAEREHQNAFFTPLILISLQGVSGNDAIVQRGLKFIKSQQGKIGSWNYWDRDSRIARQHPFPDDLDDTAYALLALSIYEPAYVDGGVLGQLAKLLIANELKPGGPYRTWLVEPALYSDWGDTDLVVNANIGSLLAQHGVKVPVLQEYVAGELAAGRLGSHYYIGEIPTLYFLSRWYTRQDLKSLVTEGLKNIDSKSAMETAMLLTAGCRLDVSRDLLTGAYDQLIGQFDQDHWPAAAIYIELAIKGQLYYAGSATLTTALAIEALNFYQNLSNQPAVRRQDNKVPDIYSNLLKTTSGVPPRLQKAYLKTANNLIQADTQGQIINMSGLTAQAFGLKTSVNASRRNLNLASLNGWLAYSIYDDFYDEEAALPTLSVANYAHRRLVTHYQAALPDDTEFSQLVRQALDIIDAANYWEVTKARAVVEDGWVYYQRLPAYSDYSKLAERSWGHMLSAVGTLISAGYRAESQEVISLKKFFHHYLIARQLNDDAHDWLEDLSRGHLTAVVTLLLKAYKPDGPINVDEEQKDLKAHFWQYTIVEVGELINKHLKMARRHLRKSGVQGDEAFTAWLDNLESATAKALDGSQQAQKFIISYTKH